MLMKNAPLTVAVVALNISKSVARMPCYSHRLGVFHNAVRCSNFICYCISHVTGVSPALQMNELAACSGAIPLRFDYITFPERACGHMINPAERSRPQRRSTKITSLRSL
jgi:hypothetical protein